MVIVPGMQDTASMQPKLTPEDVQLLRQLNERDRQVLGGMPRPRAIARTSGDAAAPGGHTFQ